MKQWNNEEWKNKMESGLIGPDPSFRNKKNSAAWEESDDREQAAAWEDSEDKELAEEAEEPSAEKEQQRAVAKAMQLLLYRQRTEKELRAKLREKEFSPEAEEAAVAYVKSFGYLDDSRYAEVYLHSNQGKKSRAVIRRELQEKGVSSEWIELAFEENPADEGEVVRALLLKRAGEPHRLNEKELRRHVQYLQRKGFPTSEIWKQIRRYEESIKNP